ncbi:ABC transporter permease [Helcococcus kunzii]|uniref:ABC transporter permease n=1 Tax=Helcococcus kunzii TaxID=40091 RepID=UPI00389F355F
MLNLFNYELKRAFKSKSTYVIMLIFIFFTLLPIVVNYYSIKGAEDPAYLRAMQTDSIEDFQREIQDQSDKKMDKNQLETLKKDTINKQFSFEENVKHFNGGSILLIMLTVFVSITATKEYTSGYIKNLLTIKDYRKMMPFAKIFIAIVYAILLMIVTIIIYSLTSKILTGNLNIDWSKLLTFSGINLLSLTTISAMIILIANLSGNITTTSIVSILLVQQILIPFFNMFDGLKLLPFKLVDISLINKASNFTMELADNEMMNYIKEFLPLIAVYFVVYLLLNLTVLNKKDINIG